MEEGPEPQEFLEHVEHSIEEKHPAKHMRSAITAAILAVLAALGSLLSGHAANDAILLRSKASDQWSYYQAKSTKGHLYEVNKNLIETLMQAQTIDKSTALTDLTKSIDSKVHTYQKEQKEIEEKALDLEKESEHEFAAHQMYSFAVACFQICIVLASISILVDSTMLYQCSIAGGVVGVILMLVGYFK
jgi:hypothetical protein